ncbi:hypothetical protein MCP_0284 [Methanocella paludicola SANAE]|uniref:Uncharacterized protein n=1 Tax=Methanocella paludicola (strain DSM 17711 / JCM 13418 / NBRC 101707 / SANAE) TaxID=304371 RepID=D1YV84_METPS|nr:hypothetical protein [Methanocella paludicola]BAI60356.1 hypothetical protein MCP_0284 [Methanocella paludicola SANAE]
MRVKLLIALALASIFLLAGSFPAGAVIGKTGTSSTSVIVPTVLTVPTVANSIVKPCISFPATSAPLAGQCLANTITLGGPALQTSIQLFAPQTPTFAPPNFVLPNLSPPLITAFSCTSPIFDP